MTMLGAVQDVQLYRRTHPVSAAWISESKLKRLLNSTKKNVNAAGVKSRSNARGTRSHLRKHIVHMLDTPEKAPISLCADSTTFHTSDTSPMPHYLDPSGNVDSSSV